MRVSKTRSGGLRGAKIRRGVTALKKIRPPARGAGHGAAVGAAAGDTTGKFSDVDVDPKFEEFQGVLGNTNSLGSGKGGKGWDVCMKALAPRGLAPRGQKFSRFHNIVSNLQQQQAHNSAFPVRRISATRNRGAQPLPTTDSFSMKARQPKRHSKRRSSATQNGEGKGINNKAAGCGGQSKETGAHTHTPHNYNNSAENV